MWIKLNEEGGVGQLLKEWWHKLPEHDRGGRAQLRRASSVSDALMCPSFQRLQRSAVRMNPDFFDPLKPYRLDRLALVCALLAHVRANGTLSLPHAMSYKTPGEERNPVSALRFQRLLESTDDEALFTGLRRVLPLIDSQVNLLSLAESVLNWGDRVKRQWAYDYDWPA